MSQAVTMKLIEVCYVLVPVVLFFGGVIIAGKMKRKNNLKGVLPAE